MEADNKGYDTFIVSGDKESVLSLQKKLKEKAVLKVLAVMI